MKHIKNKIALLGLAVAGFSACKKDTSNQPTLNLTNAKVELTSNYTSPLILDSANGANNAIVFSWDSAKVGYSYASTYTLEYDAPSDNFALPQSVVMTGYTNTITVQALDIIANALQFVNGSNDSLSVRIKVTLTQENTGAGSILVAPIYSNVITVIVNPYYIPIPYTFLWVPGAYQTPTSWSPPAAPQLASQNNINYEGFVFMNATGVQDFKFTNQNSWNGTNYGDIGATATTGNVTTDGFSTAGSAANLTVPSGGYYFFQVNVSALTYSGILINTFVANGSATGNNPVTLSYDTTANYWYANNVSLSAGSLQYIGEMAGVSGDSTLTYGQGTQDSYHIKENAKNKINVPVSGNYNIRLVLSVPDNYTDTLTKL